MLWSSTAAAPMLRPCIVDGEVVVEKGRSTRINDDELFAQAEAGAKRAWDNWAGARLGGQKRRANHPTGISNEER